MRSLALYGCVLSLLIFSACKEATVNPSSGQPTKNGQIYYTTLDLDAKMQNVYRINSDGTEKKLIYRDAGILSAPAFGRLGITRKISETQGDIALLDLNGTVLNTIISTSGAASGIDYPMLSPTANKILYLITQYDGIKRLTEIHSVNVDGTQDIILEAKAASEHIPVWSPDGTKVAYFIHGEYDAQNRSRDTLCIINANGTGRRQLINEAKSINDGFESLDWSPDGTKLVCLTESVENGYDIIVVGVDNAEIDQITTDHLPKLMPVFSPDSKKIAFCSGERIDSDVAVGISIVDVDGGNRRNITISTVASTMYPRWSPDGKSIVVTELNQGKPDPISGTLKLIDVVTGNITILDQSVYKAYWSKP